ncbi:MAG: DNA-binding domain-containing protein, partial [Prosthecobacter sp.]|nr:DNA-binding domain-containing protein [Prosthecobacter sp.]
MSTRLSPPNIRNVADLKQLQRVMGAALMRPLTKDDGMQAQWEDGRASSTAVEEFIKPNDRLSSFDRLEIYNRQYWFRLLDCLYDDYPGLRALLGQHKFHALCRAYLARHPSTSWTLRNLGQRLASFIEEEASLTQPKTAMALDIVRFEWAQVLAFDEAKRKPLDVSELLGSAPESLRLGLQPHLVLLELQHAVDDHFLAVRQQDGGLRGAASNALDQAPRRTAVKRVPPPKPQKLWLAVHRCDNALYFKRLAR